MSYFADNYLKVSYPTADTGPGLYNAQLGAIHAIGSHFTISDEPVVITMPTGSGKTAVLMMAPYIVKCTRALIVTPSVMVRDQIREDVEQLDTLIGAAVLPADIQKPKVKELRTRIDNLDEWEALSEFDAVVTTPNCASPGYANIPVPPIGLFDVLLIDEAHHSPATTWANLIAAFPTAKTILFTATPYRRDRAEIKGKFIYSYPIARAYKDKIFGQITFLPVDAPPNAADNDLVIAKAAEAALNEDRKAGFNHRLMVRTDGKPRAEQLAKLYQAKTALKLELIHSGHSNRHAKKTIDRLRAGELDGIVCVNMLGEGFNFPNLKIAAIHAPHRSLEVTLQFIGRFARTNSPDIGPAKFIAIPNEIDIEGQRLFAEGAIWQELIVGMSQKRLAAELNIREAIQGFTSETSGEAEFEDLSLYSLYPRSHVKILDISKSKKPVALDATLEFKPGVEVSYRAVNQAGCVMVVVTCERGQPRWSDGDAVFDTKYDLFVVYVDTASQLMFINSSRSVDGLYKAFTNALAPDAKPLVMGQVKRVVKGIGNQKVFNIGMRNILAANNTESYRIITGSNSQAAVKPSDGRLYRQGHVFMSGEEQQQKVTIGYSSGSKVWAAASAQIPDLVAWCQELAKKIRSVGEIVTNGGLDYLSTGTTVEKIPAGIIYAQWDKQAFDYDTPVLVEYMSDNGTLIRCHISDLDVEIDHDQTTPDRIRFTLRGDGSLEYPMDFSIDAFYEAVNGDETTLEVLRGNARESMVDYLNEFFMDFHTANGALLKGIELFEPNEKASPIDPAQITVVDWAGTDIQNELSPGGGQLSIHSHLRQLLEKTAADIIYYDHGSGEIADYVTVTRQSDTLSIGLYHCKGSKESKPGARVEDAYEVCGQAEKSVVWAQSLLRLLKKIEGRRSRSTFVRGSWNDVRKLFDEAKNIRKRFEIIIVQPGLGKAKLSGPLAEVLGATSDHVRNAGCESLAVFASA
jgi:superfamily II DNA or RNA helicase